MGKPERTKHDRRKADKRPVEVRSRRDAVKRSLPTLKKRQRARERCDRGE